MKKDDMHSIYLCILSLPNAAPSSEEAAKSICKKQVDLRSGRLEASHQSAMTSGNPENINCLEAALVSICCNCNLQKVTR